MRPFSRRAAEGSESKEGSFGSVLRVFRYLRIYPWLGLGTLVCAVLTTLSAFVFPKVTGQIVDKVLTAGRPDLLMRYVWIAAAAFLARDAFNSLRIRLNNIFEQNVVRDLRRDLYNAMQRLPLPWFEQRATGDLMTRVTDDVTSVERVLIDGVEQGVVAALQIAGIGFILFHNNPRLAAWMLLPIPLIGFGAWLYTTTPDRYRAQRRAASAMNSLLLDNLHGIRQIKSYAREEVEGRRFADAAETVRTTQLWVMHVWATYSPAMRFCGALGTVIVLWIGGRDVLAGRFTAGQLVEFVLYVNLFYDPIGQLNQLNQLWQAARPASERVFQIIDAGQEAYDPAGRPNAVTAGCALPRIEGAVSFRNISFNYQPDQPILHEVNLDVKAGQTVALVGPTGAGKTTLVSLIPRFYEATSGAVLIDGRDTRDYPLALLRSQIGLVTQESFLFNTTVRENLLFGRPNAGDDELREAARAAHAEEFILALPKGYDTEVGERGVKLSVGEKQRIAIARALLKNPPILIFDEATASVDTVTEKLIQAALERLLKGRTSFLIAHRLSTVRKADLIVVVKKGRVVEQGTHAELLASGGLYARLSTVQHPDFIEDGVFAG